MQEQTRARRVIGREIILGKEGEVHPVCATFAAAKHQTLTTGAPIANTPVKLPKVRPSSRASPNTTPAQLLALKVNLSFLLLTFSFAMRRGCSVENLVRCHCCPKCTHESPPPPNPALRSCPTVPDSVRNSQHGGCWVGIQHRPGGTGDSTAVRSSRLPNASDSAFA